MNRRKFLYKILVTLLVIGCLFFVYVLATALQPNSATENPKMGFLVSGLAAGESMVVEYSGQPVLILNKGDGGYEVWSLRANFIESGITSCAIQRTESELNPETKFYEPCRSVHYDGNGEVLSGSYVGALPMTKFKYEKVGDRLVIVPAA